MKRVLILSYYFPPAGGSAVQRSLALAKYLPECGWMPTVVTVDSTYASYPMTDASLTIPGGTCVVRTPAWDPYNLYAVVSGKSVSVGFAGESEPNPVQRLARWIRANVFIPDARVGWAPFAFAFADRLLRRKRFDALLTTGPPHSTHLAGLWLRKRHDIRWVADMRDAWTEVDYADELPSSLPARLVNYRMESAVIRSADAVVAVTESMRKRLLRGRDVFRKTSVIPNGFDPSDFCERVPAAREFVIAHVGTMNASRNPVALFEAIRRTSIPVRLCFTGHVDPSVLEAAQKVCLQIEDPVPHNIAIERMQQAAVLLLSINNVPGAEGIATGKLYEYIASGRPVLGIGPTSGDAAKVLQRSGAGVMFGYEDVPQLALTLERWYERWAAGTLFWTSPEKARPYSRREQTKQYAALLASHIPAEMKH